jgi:caa(3)-type oxidase subunit IV
MTQKNQKQHHHIMPPRVAFLIGGILLVLTIVTVSVAQIDLGHFNFLIAMLVATVKALLVALFFMGLKYDDSANGIIFATSFVFLSIFMILAGTDLFFRGDVYVHQPWTASVHTQSKLKNPWISTPALVAKGKELFAVQCVSCHGVEGQGNGPAAAALNPHPRNFTLTEGWKNGRKPTMVFKTLKEGLPPSAMASYASLPSDDRWALSHFVLSLGPPPQADTPADFAKAGVNPNEVGGGEKVEATIPIELALERLEVADRVSDMQAQLFHPSLADPGESEAFEGDAQVHPVSLGQQVYRARCEQCHSIKGEGQVKVQNLGVYPVAFVVTSAFQNKMESLQSQSSFNRLMTQGMPGSLMPSVGQLSQTEAQSLFQYVKSLASRLDP